MTEQQYLQEIKGMVLQSLKIEYAATLPNKAELEKSSNETLIKLVQDEQLFNEVANQIKEWSYNEASKFQYARKPESAKSFLSLVSIRNFTNDYVKNYEQSLQNNNQQTR